jgi:diguanylate cyclase (GGDEF)-like protein
MRSPLVDTGVPVDLVDVATPLDDVRRLFYADATLRAVAVHGEPAGPRLLTAETVLRTPARPGLALRDVRCCPSGVLSADVGVRDAVVTALARPEEHRGHDLLVWDETGSVLLVPVADLLSHLADLHEHGQESDALTGLFSRSTISRHLRDTLDDAVEGTLVAVAFLDLDRFKEVNDRHGHAIGDRVLQTVGRRLGNALRDTDAIGRMGGDEFLAVMQVQDANEARAAAERLLERVVDPIDQGTLTLQVGLSVGVAIGRVGTDRAERLVADADALMYLAKQQGGGVLVADDASNVVITRSQLSTALAEQTLALHYQPIVPLDGSPFTAVEALVRWPREDGTFLPPSAFVPLAEATGQVVDLDWWAIQTGVQQLTTWDGLHADDAPWNVHVNISARTLAVPGIVSHVQRLLAHAGVLPGRLTLEVTETAVIGDITRAVAVLTSLRTIGVHTAIDDFGVGQSSLAQLTRLPVSSLKIDRSFIIRLAEHEVDQGVVRLVRTLADELGLDVVAEGVESEEQARMLESLGVTHAQGWLWSPALDGIDVRALDRAAALNETV